MSSPAQSQPSTPSRSPNASPIITPRTKYRLLLEDSSDSDVSLNPIAAPRKRLSPTRSSPPPHDDDILMTDAAPRAGTLAARMRGITATKVSEPTAAARTKPKSLFGGVDNGSDSNIPEATVTKPKSIFGGGGGSASDADEDDDLPVVPRRKRRSPTPRISATSPQPAREYHDSSDEDDAPAAILKTDRFKALVVKAQRERLEKEAAEKEKITRRREVEDEMVMSSEDGEMTKTGKARKDKGERPVRKTAKKAMLDIQKETQRMQRNQQLAHEARSRTKVTKNDLFAKFGFKPEGVEEEEPVRAEKKVNIEEVVMEDVPEVQEENGGSASDVEEIFNKLVDAATKGPTPKKKPASPAATKAAPPTPQIDKGKGRALPSPPPPDPKPERPLRIHLPAKALQLDSDDSDLEIIDPAREKEKVNARAGAEKQKLIQSLIRERKYTANIRLSPNKKNAPTAKQLHAKLQAASRKQAVNEREERMQELRAQGIHIPTAEEREKEMAEVENLVEKARLEAMRIKKLERRREKAKKGEKLDDDDDEDDGDWFNGEVPEDEGLTQMSAEDSDEAAFLDGEAEDSGSSDNDEENDSDEEKEDVEMEGADEPVSPTFSLSSIKAPQRDSVSPTPRLSDMPTVLEDSDSDDGAFAPLKRKQRRAARVIDDEEEDEAPPTVQKQKPEPSSVPDIFRNFAGPSMGMTQLFAGSAASTADVVGTMGAKVDALRLRHAPEDSIPNSQAPDEDESQDVVPDTQLGNKLDLSYTQDVEYQVLATQEEEPMSTQDMPEPTQDHGFTLSSSPVPPRFTSRSPTGTVPTQLFDNDELSPSKPKRGRLSRTRQNFSDSEQSATDSSAESDPAPSPVKKAPKPKRAPAPAYDKKTSEAKGLFHEQASESEDEYAGIGGASGDEASDASDAEIRAMLNDTHDETLDERELAAFYAKRAVADDERDVSKIFRDLQSGLLRKKRGAGAADLDDSDDEYSEILRKQRAKKRQMAAIRRLLTQDQTLEKIAKDPKKAAFFKSLEGDASDVDDDFLDREAENPFETQESATPVESAGDTQPTSAEPSQQQVRRPVKTSRPGLANIRETLSFLVEDKTLLSASDSEPEPEPAPTNPRRTTTIIDRTTLSRSSSNSHQSKLAFKPDGAEAASGFRVPTLLRRATTGLSSVSGASGSIGSREGSMVTERSLGEQGLKKGGGKVRAVGGFKKKKVEKGEEMERKRKREREVEAVKRRGMGVGGLGGGSGVFE